MSMDLDAPTDPISENDSPESAEPIEVARYADPSEAIPTATEASPDISHELPPQFQNVSAKGGAVAAIVLGCLAIFGAFVTQWSLFNAIVGLVLGLWGLRSNLTRTAMLGICVCVIGIVLCAVMRSVEVAQ